MWLLPSTCEAGSGCCLPFRATLHRTDVDRPEGVWGKPLRWWGWSTHPARSGCGAEAGSARAEMGSGEILSLSAVTCWLGVEKTEQDPSQRHPVEGREATLTGGTAGNSNFTCKKSYNGGSEASDRSLERGCGMSIPGGHSKLNWRQLWAACSRWCYSEQQIGLEIS